MAEETKVADKKKKTRRPVSYAAVIRDTNSGEVKNANGFKTLDSVLGAIKFVVGDNTDRRYEYDIHKTMLVHSVRKDEHSQIPNGTGKGLREETSDNQQKRKK